MPIETKCTNCGRTLRVSDEHAGRQARCPVCQTIYTVPTASQALGSIPTSASAYTPLAPPPTPTDTLWFLRTVGGQVYGPVPKTDLDRWVNEGRVDRNCQVRYGESNPWIDANHIYPNLNAGPAMVRTSSNPYADMVEVPASSPTYGKTSDARAAYFLPHRGPLILTLGIATWVIFCPILGALAWILGSKDLNDIRAGRMNPEGEGLTQVGRILGMLNVILVFGGIVLTILMTIFVALAH